MLEEIMKGLGLWVWVLVMQAIVVPSSHAISYKHRLLLDTDVDTDDFFALLYLLKLNRSEFNLQAVTIDTNSWTNAGHAANQIYDILYMMGRDDIDVGVGGEGGILENGTIQPNVGGCLPIIDQERGTAGPCRYRQSIPVGRGGRLDIDTNFGLRRSFLPQQNVVVGRVYCSESLGGLLPFGHPGRNTRKSDWSNGESGSFPKFYTNGFSQTGNRRYSPLRQPTAQQVLIKKISKGPISVLLTGTHTNLAIFLMTNPNLKKNINHIYIMGGGVRPKNPTGCCQKNVSSSCHPQQCGDRGNIFTTFRSNPYAEFNIFADPFAAYQVIHSGIPITLVPLDATNTIPISEEFFTAFQQNQRTFEAQYVFKSLKMARDTWFTNQFFTSYFMWDSFMWGVATSSMRKMDEENTENEFAEMEYMNITVITSNEPYGICDGSNTFINDRKIPKFGLQKNGVHSGHVQTGIRDPFCLRENSTGICKDGYTEEVTGPDSVRVRVATRAKPNVDKTSTLDREYFVSFLDVLNLPENKGRFNFTSEFPRYQEVLYKPEFTGKKLGKTVVFDMDMSAGDFLTLFYLLKVPVEEIYVKAILVTGTGWANTATIDIVYDLLHMMGRDDILVGLGDSFGVNQSYPNSPAVGDCKYSQAIPHGGGGRLDPDTLFGLTRDLPRSPRRYTAENSAKFGAPHDTDFPQLRQPLALEVWRCLVNSMDNDGSRITILTNGPLTNLSNILLLESNSSSIIQEVFIVGGHVNYKKNKEKGNVMNVPLNKFAELNMFLDPLAAKTVFDSSLDITLIPLHMQRKLYSFPNILKLLQPKNTSHMTPEAAFVRRLFTRLHRLHRRHHSYRHVDMFFGEILGAFIVTADPKLINSTFEMKHLKVYADGNLSKDGKVILDTQKTKGFKMLEGFNHASCYTIFSNLILKRKQSAVIGSFNDQKRLWGSPAT